MSINVHANPDKQFQFETDTFSFINFAKEPLSYEDTIEVLESVEWASSLPDWTLSLLADVVMEMNNGSNGNCWGMAYTTKYYYENPEAFKNKYPEYSTINELKKEEIAPEIIYNQEISQFTMQNYVFNGILYYMGIAKLEEQIPFVLEQINNNKPEIITIDVNWGQETTYHAVLAYDYTLSYEDKGVTLHIYDSNVPGIIQNITLLPNPTGQYNIQTMDFTINYKTTELAAETYYEPDWDFIIQNQEKIREVILGRLPLNPIEEILKVITLIAGISIVLIISLVLVLKRFKSYRMKGGLGTSNQLEYHPKFK